MPEVFIGVGSNTDAERHLRMAVTALAERFGLLRLSPVYRNRAVGFEGEDFYNMVIAFETDEPVPAVVAELERVERASGRRRDGPKFASRTLDLDLLLYGEEVAEHGQTSVPRDEITRYDFVLKPLLDLEPDLRHPETGQSLAGIWADFDRDGHPLEQVAVSWTRP